MENGSQNGHRSGDEETPDEHRAGHLQNLLDEVLTLLVEEAHDDDDVEDTVEDVLISLLETVGSRVHRLPKPLVQALAAWIGADPRGYLRGLYTDERGHIAEHTPESIVRYLLSTDEDYWPED
ncbi:MAG: hypothetical protein IT306_16385 [Chloroflexi bacterium]|nr:hypothetical protein [Chloroflexota bacterium]